MADVRDGDFFPEDEADQAVVARDPMTERAEREAIRIAEALERLAPAALPRPDFSAARLFRHDPDTGGFLPAPAYPLSLEALVGLERQKARFLENLQRFARGRFTLHLRTRALAIGQNDVELLPAYLPAGGPGAFRVPAERVVFISHNAPNRELAIELATSGIPLQIIGDANAPRFLPVAIREGRLAGIAV